MNTLDNWREKQLHVPEFMRDFHDQKDLFKALLEVTPPDGQEDAKTILSGLNLHNSHVFVVDYFLWVLAAHGYTLQRSRQKFEFRDINKFVSESRERRLKRHAEELARYISETKDPNQ